MEVGAKAERANQEVSKNDSNLSAAAETFFDCSICLDSAVDPVVTLCGHLYCWQCIRNWLKPSSNTCPVCKAPLSESTLIPLYGRGRNNSQQDTTKIPNRPSIPHEMFDSVIQPTPQQHHQYYNYPYPHSSVVAASVLHSNAGGVLCGMADAILPWLLRDNSHSIGSYNLSPYLLDARGNNPRLRRQELQVEIWLHQFWLFLFSCVLLGFLFL